MSRIRKCLTFTASAAAGLFLAALASSATAAADTATPVSPGWPGLVEQMVTSSANLPQQLLQTTTSALTGSPLAPAAAPANAPIASATLNIPQTSTALTPGAGVPAGLQNLPGLSMPGNLSSVLPFPLPNLGGVTPTVPTAPVGLPAGFLPSIPVPPPAPIEVQLLPGLP